MNEKKRYAFAFWMAIAVILILNILLWLYLNQVESRFTTNLKDRLVSENRFLSRIINDEYLSMIIPGQTNSIEYISILQTLENVRREDSLQSIIILDPDGKILVSAPEIIAAQSESIRSDNALFEQALQGSFVTSNIQQIGQEQFMSSYGPLNDIYGMTIGVQIVEAKATYFKTIENLRNQLILFSLINIIVITGIAFFLFRMIDRVINIQALVKDREHLAQLGTMSASVAHELRNPLGIIEGSNELIRKKYGRADDEIFGYIPTETNRLSKIIDSFLTFARTPRVDKKPFNISDLLSRLKVGINNTNNVTIDYPEISEDIPIHSDENLLEQAILNILRNATEAAKTDSTITIRIEREKNKIHLSIHNFGLEINDKTMQEIFKPFFTTKEQGTGLGLAISRRTIELLGGIISVKSLQKEGTTFTITLPL